MERSRLLGRAVAEQPHGLPMERSRLPAARSDNQARRRWNTAARYRSWPQRSRDAKAGRFNRPQKTVKRGEKVPNLSLFRGNMRAG